MWNSLRRCGCGTGQRTLVCVWLCACVAVLCGCVWVAVCEWLCAAVCVRGYLAVGNAAMVITPSFAGVRVLFRNLIGTWWKWLLNLQFKHRHTLLSEDDIDKLLRRNAGASDER